MGVSIRVTPGDWGGAPPADIEKAAQSAANSLDAFPEGESVSIVIEPTGSEVDLPVTLVELNGQGEFVIQLPVRDTHWAQFAYQSAHEFCHVVADTRTIAFDQFTWIEEAICETASLFALNRMAESWQEHPPYQNWSDYSIKLAEYVGEHVAKPTHCVPTGETFEAWLARTLPLLETDPRHKNPNTTMAYVVIAKELLSTLEAARGVWRAIPSLHAAPRAVHSAAEYLSGWAEVVPSSHRAGVREIARILT